MGVLLLCVSFALEPRIPSRRLNGLPLTHGLFASLQDEERKRVADMIERNYNEWMAREKARLDRDITQAKKAAAADEAARRQRIKDTQVGGDGGEVGWTPTNLDGA